MGTTNLGRRRFGPREQVDSPNLGDFLRIKEDESYSAGRTNFSGQTLDSVLRLERSRGTVRTQSNPTLLDIIREDPTHRRDSSKTSWRDLTNRLRTRLQGSVSDPIDAPATETPTSRRVNTPGHSIRLNSPISVGSEPPQVGSSSSVGEGTAAVTEEPVRMSLMALLAETDRQMGFDGSAFLMEAEDGEEEEEEVAEKGGEGRQQKCCVCMLRRKGAAFIPCGHTFCRLCTRELWVQRGHCPLCNTLILEILDIF